METPETYEEAKARRRQRTIVIVIAVIALCCVCLVVAIAIYSWSAVRGGQTQEFPSEQFPETFEPVDPGSPSDTDGPEPDLDEAPTGGLGNDILRNDTWQTV